MIVLCARQWVPPSMVEHGSHLCRRPSNDERRRPRTEGRRSRSMTGSGEADLSGGVRRSGRVNGQEQTRSRARIWQPAHVSASGKLLILARTHLT
jgi:hypothetical protein